MRYRERQTYIEAYQSDEFTSVEGKNGNINVYPEDYVIIGEDTIVMKKEEFEALYDKVDEDSYVTKEHFVEVLKLDQDVDIKTHTNHILGKKGDFVILDGVKQYALTSEELEMKFEICK